ncbi:isoprenoid synthase domain-containing protein [Cytidiella melzeri]|nr:isoprenoid synthase domain-containing protein [Cytidiella melzeri]
MPTSNVQLPDLTKICGEHFELRVNQHCLAVGEESRRWVEQHELLVGEETRAQLVATQLPLLAALCYPTCDMTQLRTSTDFLTVLFYGCYHPQMVNKEASGAAFDSVLERLRRTTNMQCWARFQTALEGIQSAARTTVKQREKPNQAVQGRTMTVEGCLSLKRVSEIFNLAFCLNEYTEDLKIPDVVLRGSPLRELKQNALDAIIWMKDIVSYNIQQSRGDMDNLVAVLMMQQQITLQAAVNQATASVRQCVQRFVELSESGALTSLDEDAKRYVQGLRDWIVGWAHWVYETEEYFLKDGEEVKAFGWLFLLPKEGEGEGR